MSPAGEGGAAPGRVVVVCEVGVPIDLQLRSQVRRRLPSGVALEHHSIDAIPVDADLLLAHPYLLDRLRRRHPTVEVVVSSATAADDVRRALGRRDRIHHRQENPSC